MFKLYYTGPKPIISQHGIFFKNGKEDKYVYLKTAVSVLLSIDKNQSDANIQLTDSNIPDILQSYEPELEKHIVAEEARYEAHIQTMIEEVHCHPLSHEDKETWIRNIHIMTPYMIQREINKLYYIHTIKAIKEVIHQDKIIEIDIDFDMKNWHILSSIAGNLEYGVKSIPTDIKVEPDKEGELIVKLLINPSH